MSLLGFDQGTGRQGSSFRGSRSATSPRVRHLRLLPLLFLACSPVLPSNDEDGGEIDAGVSFDAGSGVADAGSVVPDAGSFDAGTRDSGVPDSTVPDAGVLVDLDLDGLSDAWELDVATRFLPVLSLHPQDGCPLGGLVFRLRPHPLAPDSGLIAVTYTYLFERDCGLTSHPGDNEAFGATIDPSQPPERGITALRAIAHQNTVCSRTSTCGTCSGLSACERFAPNEPPVLYSSKDKHAGYVSRASCGTFTCFDTCAMGRRTGVPLVNAGEPNAPLTRNLTDGGFITSANGWTDQQLFHFDPWGTPNFGRAGNVKGDLEDPAFLTPTCR